MWASTTVRTSTLVNAGASTNGIVNDIARRTRGVGYPEQWLHRAVEEQGEALAVDGIDR